MPANDDVSAPESSSLEVKRGDPWLSDGNIVLQVENVQFRVLKSVLVENSEVFRDMFEIPQPLGPSAGTEDGCPVVIMQDSAEELGHALKAIFSYPYFSTRKQHAIPVILAIARISRKYQMDALFSEAYQSLRELYPSTLRGWDKRNEPSRPWTLGDFKHHLSVAKFAYEHDVADILPAACFQASQYHEIEDLVDLDVPRPLLRLLIEGSMELRALLPETTLAWLTETYTSETWKCEAESCETVCRTLVPAYILLNCEQTATTLFNPLEDFFGCASLEIDELICLECRRTLEQRHKKGSREAWTALPKAFRLKNWGQRNSLKTGCN